MSSIQIAYGAVATVVLTVRDNAGALVNVTGWTARADVEKFNDVSLWSTVLALTNSSVANGGTAGTLTLTITGPQATSLAPYFGSPTANRQGRLSFYGNSGSGDVLLMQATVELLPTGSTVVPYTGSIVGNTFSVSATAFGGFLYGEATTVVHGLMAAVDKSDHDRMRVQAKLVPAPAGGGSALSVPADIVAAAAIDTLNWKNAIAYGKANNCNIEAYPGVYYINEELDISDSRVCLEGAATGALGLNSGTVLEDVRPTRDADKYLLRAQGGWQHSRIKRITLAVNRAVGAIFMGLVGAQPISNHVEHGYIAQRSFIASTSTTSLPATKALKTVTYGALANHWDGVPPQFTVGTPIWLGSRGSGAIMRGLVSSWTPGASQFQFTPDEVYDTDGTTVADGISGNHADWDIRFPAEGIVCPQGANSTFERLVFYGLYCGVRADASYAITVRHCINATGTALGPQIRTGSTSQQLQIDCNYEPGIFGWCSFVDLGVCYDAHVRIGTGDAGTRGCILYLRGSLNTEVCGGTLSKGGAGVDNCALIQAFQTEGLKVRNLEPIMPAGAVVVEFTGFAKTPVLDLPRCPDAQLWRGVAPAAANGGWSMGSSGIPFYFTAVEASTILARNAWRAHEDTIALPPGATNALSITYALTTFTTTGNATIRGLTVTTGGQSGRFRYYGADQITFTNEDALATAANNRWRTKTGANLVMAAPAAGGFWELEYCYDSTLARCTIKELT